MGGRPCAQGRLGLHIEFQANQDYKVKLWKNQKEIYRSPEGDTHLTPPTAHTQGMGILPSEAGPGRTAAAQVAEPGGGASSPSPRPAAMEGGGGA